jgi:hypothetical protein
MATIKKAQYGRKFSDIYTGPAKTNPGVLKAKADKAKADSNISSYKKNAEKVSKTAVDSAQARLSRVKKAKDGKWIQKAVNPAHKGYCTPMTKATCTPKRKALAKTFKAMGRARKGK